MKSIREYEFRLLAKLIFVLKQCKESRPADRQDFGFYDWLAFTQIFPISLIKGDVKFRNVIYKTIRAHSQFYMTPVLQL